MMLVSFKEKREKDFVCCNFARIMFIKTMILLWTALALSWLGTHKFEAAMLPEDEGMMN